MLALNAQHLQVSAVEAAAVVHSTEKRGKHLVEQRFMRAARARTPCPVFLMWKFIDIVRYHTVHHNVCSATTLPDQSPVCVAACCGNQAELTRLKQRAVDSAYRVRRTRTYKQLDKRHGGTGASTTHLAPAFTQL